MALIELWINGSLPSDTEIAGLKLFWWARIGKIAQLLAVLLMILELVGKARSLSWANTKIENMKLQTQKWTKFRNEIFGFLGSACQALGGRSLKDHNALPEREKYIETSIAQVIVLGYFMEILAILLTLWLGDFPASLLFHHLFESFLEQDIINKIGYAMVTFLLLVFSFVAFVYLPLLVLYLLVTILLSGSVITTSFLAMTTVAMKAVFSNRAFLTLEIAVIVVAVLGFIPDLASS